MNPEIQELSKEDFFSLHGAWLCEKEFLHGFVLGFEGEDASGKNFLSMGTGRGCGVWAGDSLFLSEMALQDLESFYNYARDTAAITKMVGPRNSLLGIVSRTKLLMEQTFFALGSNYRFKKPNEFEFSRFTNQAELELWIRDFFREADPSKPEMGKSELRFFLSREFYVVSDRSGCALSMAGIIRRTAKGVGIGAVFTPVNYRGRGASSFCVGSICDLILAQGKTPFLIANNENEASIKMYRGMGFEEQGGILRLGI